MRLLEKLLATPAPAEIMRPPIVIGDMVRCRRRVGRVVRLDPPARGSTNCLLWVEFEEGGDAEPWHIRDVEKV